ncbi:unnamed protein product [Prunus armeniaca]|uniref:Uncharacterized protein n=1 Tax=Prunus armeniaca TaxID=36596 RepID=A0A6J5WVK1_PRUAR|nr:unnamed protein product [Prunus armeniaca]
MVAWWPVKGFGPRGREGRQGFLFPSCWSALGERLCLRPPPVPSAGSGGFRFARGGPPALTESARRTQLNHSHPPNEMSSEAQKELMMTDATFRAGGFIEE